MQDDGLGGPHGSESKLDQALSGGRAQTVGRFRFFIDDERWEWSDEVQQIHGYAPGQMPYPATAQVLAHKHPDDHDHVLGALEDTRRTRAAFSTRHRMIDAHGKVHRVVVVGDLMRDSSGVVGTQGFYIDVTSAQSDYEDRVSEGVTDATAKRAVIEQAKGMLGVVYGLEEDAAFEVLKWISQESNTKLRTIAEELVAEFRSLSGPALPERNIYDFKLQELCRSKPSGR
ncbi:PAS and ANTAR domain-containing protein [Mycobacteroides chelonae]|uniref:PAS and ANTAR domain-containing protein n=1 Tax=Mycobacteroides chelonae TaxID=1774 RepID=UPI001F2560AD|nr:PAS and ANTAR domain-containing protein [Mycobacteroides chelonae]